MKRIWIPQAIAGVMLLWDCLRLVMTCALAIAGVSLGLFRVHKEEGGV